jgi:peptide chain release factor 2
MSVATHSGGIFDYDQKKERLEEVLLELQHPDIWNDLARGQAMSKEKGELENSVGVLDTLSAQLDDARTSR